MFKVLGKIEDKKDIYSKGYGYFDRKELRDVADGDFFEEHKDDIIGHNMVALCYGEHLNADELDHILLDGLNDKDDAVVLVGDVDDDGKNMLVFGGYADKLAEHETDEIYDLCRSVGINDVDLKMSELEHDWIQDAIDSYAKSDVESALGDYELDEDDIDSMYDWINNNSNIKSNRVDFSTRDLIKYMKSITADKRGDDDESINEEDEVEDMDAVAADFVDDEDDNENDDEESEYNICSFKFEDLDDIEKWFVIKNNEIVNVFDNEDDASKFVEEQETNDADGDEEPIDDVEDDGDLVDGEEDEVDGETDDEVDGETDDEKDCDTDIDGDGESSFDELTDSKPKAKKVKKDIVDAEVIDEDEIDDVAKKFGFKDSNAMSKAAEDAVAKMKAEQKKIAKMVADFERKYKR